MNNFKRLSIIFTLFLFLFSSCSRIGYGVLLWSTDDPPINSGAVLPVYIKSNIEKIWVVGLPEPAAGANRDVKIEIPLTQLEFLGRKRNAAAWAQNFSPHALSYAENMQDGLPIRENPDNNSRRVYRLRLGEIIKVLGESEGSAPIGTTGDPLPGEWLRVLTHDGIIGFCFSYRLRLFEQTAGSAVAAPAIAGEVEPDPDLDIILSRTWSAESYQQMINSRRINIQELEKKYRFEPGAESGAARIILPDLDRLFFYEKIVKEEDRVWRFEGANLRMMLRTNSVLTVQFIDGADRRTLTFVALSSVVDDIILRENSRRESLFMSIYEEGPVFTSSNYGTITFIEDGGFTWTGYRALVPHLIPEETNGAGRINMNLFITPSLDERYNGAFTMQFTDIRSNNTLNFMYVLDSQGLRLEAVPDYGIEDITITRRASSPMVLYFFRDSPLY